MSYINYYEYNPTQETLYKRVYDPTINRVDLQYIVGYLLLDTFHIYQLKC